MHIRFLVVSEVGFLGHRTGLKFMFSKVSLFKILPCHIHMPFLRIFFVESKHSQNFVFNRAVFL